MSESRLVTMVCHHVWVVVATALLVGLSAAQWPSTAQDPLKVRPGSQPRQLSNTPLIQTLQDVIETSSNVQSHQVIQGPVKPLSWRFPVPPVILRPAPVHFDRPIPAALQTVSAECTENTVRVEVEKDLFSTGEPIDVSVLTLGGCPAQGQDGVRQTIIYESQLQGCNSYLVMTEDEFVYVFALYYGVPSPLGGTPISRNVVGQGATVIIECHYPRFQNVSSGPLIPAWVPYASTHVAEEYLLFSLRLMMDDWVSERASNQYFLGELINIEASVLQFFHVPLRLYINGCVATPVPDLNAMPRYTFMDNYGCMLDAKLTGSSSRFIPQTQSCKLGFQLEAFRFQKVTSSLIYIACYLKATAASFQPDSEHKACSYTENGWTAASGDNSVCSCCDSNCSAVTKKGRDLSSDHDLQMEGRVTIGPIIVEEHGP